MKVAVLGARKFGAFHAREFRNAGCDVSAILGSTEETVRLAAEELSASYGIRPRVYHRLETLLREVRPDAVSICTPPSLHERFSYACLDARVHVMCEKPLAQSPYAEGAARSLLELAQTRGKVFTMNTQWPSILEYLDPIVLTNFSVYMESGQRGYSLPNDHIPHANSLLVRLLPRGTSRNIVFSNKSEEFVAMRFTYQSGTCVCAADYAFRYKAERPRAVVFTFNGETYRREIGDDYRQRFVSERLSFEITDPLKVSISRFVNACKGNGLTLVSSREIQENCALQDALMSAYEAS